MPHIIEIAILLILVFLIGCVIGYFVRLRLFPKTINKDTVEVADASPAKPAASQATMPPAATTSEPAPPAGPKKIPAQPAPATTKKAAPAKPAAVKAKPAKAQTASKPSPRAAAQATKTAAKPKAPAKPKMKAKPKPAAKSPSDIGGRPPTLNAPRPGGKDDLKRLSGVGPKLEATLNGLGIYHFDQIASWDRDAVAWVDDNLSFKGRIDREGWIAQAAKLAAEK